MRVEGLDHDSDPTAQVERLSGYGLQLQGSGTDWEGWEKK